VRPRPAGVVNDAVDFHIFSWFLVVLIFYLPATGPAILGLFE
jgi:hypothetical protein